VLDNIGYGDARTDTALRNLIVELMAGGERFSVSRYSLSRDHDIRPLVVATVLTYLELRGILTATGPFYAGYKISFIRPRSAVLDRFEGARRQFVHNVFDAGKMGRTWLTLEPDAVAEQLGEPRQRVITAIHWLEQQGDIQTKPSGLRHGYRRTVEVDIDALTAELVGDFEARERADIDRTAAVLAFTERGDCLTRALVGYFGEDLPHPCGHCGPCEGDPGGPLPRSPATALSAQDTDLIRGLAAEHHAPLAHPRALARFVCGLRSPATSGRNGLQRDRRFGALEGAPFLDVLRVCEGL